MKRIETRDPKAANRQNELDRDWITFRSKANRSDRNRIRWALGTAIAGHALLAFVQLPGGSSLTSVEAQTPRVFEMSPMPRLKIPQEPTPVLPRRRESRVAIPVPAHLLTEPLRAVEVAPVEVALPDFDGPEIIPMGPPPLSPPVDQPMEIRGEVRAPVKAFAPAPRYPETLRRAGVGGRVILRAVIDPHGEVTSIEVLSPAQKRLTEAAVEAVEQWRYEPATWRGRAVAVYMTLTVNFDTR